MRCLFYGKKAVIDIQFNWIFVIIIGALILLFFVTVIKSTEKSSTNTINAELVQHLDNIISQSIADVGTTRTIKMPNAGVEVDCSQINIQSASTSGKSIVYKSIFSPSLIKDRTDMIAYSINYQMPYPVDYFLILTSKQIRYNFIRNSGCNNCIRMIDDIVDKLPRNLTYEIIDNASEAKENNYYEERFIYFNQSPVFYDNMKSMSKVIAINYADANLYHGGDYLYGNFDYYNVRNNNFNLVSNHDYLGYPMLIGSIFSEISNYDCNVDKAMLRYEMLTYIYNNKTHYLSDLYDLAIPGTHEFSCYQIYNSYNLANVINMLKNKNYDFETMSINTKRLSEANRNALYQTCPLIY